ncbi:polysaccharide biosynthesis tyrosine autokinase [Sphingomonas sp.]|uniref:GumC family protein n=1 Tax=Sphingomonas sp. TaxID=28214 RepID=UPI001D4B08B9|nr:polysaccharide biosynthesis tyrosine autokinase [Sphingomonas sp.]MBX9796001.1 polysaccharide biosynthesis tyrosine autokinase [Sphingomonas sp.]
MNAIDTPSSRAIVAAPGNAMVEWRAKAGDLAERESIIQNWIRILLRWRWLILGSVIAGLLTSIGVTLLLTKQYTSTVTLEISREDSNIVNIRGAEPQVSAIDQEFYQTQYGLLKARSLAEAVADRLKLYDSRKFLRLFGERVDGGLFTDAGGPLPPATRQSRRDKTIRILLNHFSVAPVRASRLVGMSFESPDAQMSADIANAWADEFIKRNLARRFDANSYARSFLESRIAQIKTKLEESERQLVAYASQNHIITMGTPSNDTNARSQERSVLTDTLIALNEQLAAARGARIAAETRRSQAGSGVTAENLGNQAINALRQRRAEVAADAARLSAQFQPDYPPLQALNAQLRQLDNGIAREEARGRSSLDVNYRQALAQENALATKVAEVEAQVIEQRRLGIQYNIYQRDADTNRELYNALLQRYKEIGVAGGIGTNNVAVVDRGLPANRPSSPRPLLNIILGLILGTAVGIGLAFMLEQIDEGIAVPDDLERLFHIPSLGAIPKSLDEEVLIAMQDRKSALAEAFLSFEAALRFSTPEGMPRSLLITSTVPGEGKSTTTVALATTLARLGRKVLLIDADMRSPSLHQMMELRNLQGLSNVLSGNGSLAQMAVPTHQENLWLLSAGPTPPNAAELFSGSQVDALIQDALAEFDTVLFDAPPVMALADAPLLASRVSGTVIVVEASATRKRQLRVTLQRLKSAHASIIGAVLTKFDSRRVQYGYGYESYGYGYGDRSKDFAKA